MRSSRQLAMSARAILSGCAMILTALGAPAGVTYQYDNAGRLRTTTYSGGGKTIYTLDAAGNRKTIQSGPPGTVASNQSAPSDRPQSSAPVLTASAADRLLSLPSIVAIATDAASPTLVSAEARLYQSPMANAAGTREGPGTVSDTMASAAGGVVKAPSADQPAAQTTTPSQALRPPRANSAEDQKVARFRRVERPSIASTSYQEPDAQIVATEF